MNFVIVLGIVVLSNLSVSLCRCTVSNALDMSSAMAIVRCGGLRWLSPVVMMLFMLCSAVLVERCCLKPCWCSGSVMLFVMCGRIIFSSVLAMGESSAMGL